MKIFFLILFFATVSFGQDFNLEDGWLGILPIQNNRADVEEKLGSPKKISGNSYLYETENAVISFSYSDEPCSKKEFGGWNVPKDTILNYSVGTKNHLLVSDLRWTKNKFYRNNEPRKGEDAVYINYENNIKLNAVIEENNTEIVMSIFVFPAKKYKYLKCN